MVFDKFFSSWRTTVVSSNDIGINDSSAKGVMTIRIAKAAFASEICGKINKKDTIESLYIVFIDIFILNILLEPQTGIKPVTSSLP